MRVHTFVTRFIGILIRMPSTIRAMRSVFSATSAFRSPAVFQPGNGLLVNGDAAFPIPAGIRSFIGTRLLTVREKWQLARFLMRLTKLDARQFDGVSLRDWLDQTIGSGNLALLLGALFRVSTYCDDPERMSAGVALHQLKLALAGNVWYLDGGWQTLIDGLRNQAAAHGADFRTGTRAKAVRSRGDGVSVELASGGELQRRAP